MVDEMIEQIKQDTELDEHQQRQLWCIVKLHISNPLSVDCLPFGLS